MKISEKFIGPSKKNEEIQQKAASSIEKLEDCVQLTIYGNKTSVSNSFYNENKEYIDWFIDILDELVEKYVREYLEAFSLGMIKLEELGEVTLMPFVYYIMDIMSE